MGDAEAITTPIVILGLGGGALDVLDCLEDLNRAAGRTLYRAAGFLDDSPAAQGTRLRDLPVLGPLASAAEHARTLGARFVNTIGAVSSFRRKKHILAATGLPPERFETLVHPTAYVSPSARLGRGVVLMHQVTVASQVVIGDQVYVYPQTVFNHHDRIGDYATFASGVCLSGHVTVGESCYLGGNCAVKERITIGDGCLVGLGAVVIADLPPGAVAVGNPARVLRVEAQGPGEQER